MSGALLAMGHENIELFGHVHSLDGSPRSCSTSWASSGEILLLTSIYLVMPVGRLSLKHALIGGITAGVAVGAARHVLAGTSPRSRRSGLVYGSLTTAIVALLTLEIASLVLLLGAQVIAEYERLSHEAHAASEHRAQLHT